MNPDEDSAIFFYYERSMNLTPNTMLMVIWRAYGPFGTKHDFPVKQEIMGYNCWCFDNNRPFVRPPWKDWIYSKQIKHALKTDDYLFL